MKNNLKHPNPKDQSQKPAKQPAGLVNKLHYLFEESALAPVVRFFIVFLIISSSGLALFEIVNPQEMVPYLRLVFYFEQFVLWTFTAEYVLRFLAAPNKLKFFLNKLNIVDLLAIVPFYFGINVFYLRLFRLLRLLRMFRFLKIYEIFKFRGTIIEKITPFLLILLILKIVVWILEFKGYWIKQFDLGILLTIVGFSLGIVLSQKISKTYDNFFSIRKTMFELQGKLTGMRYFMNAVKRGEGTRAIAKWLSQFILLYHKNDNIIKEFDAINEELYTSILGLGNGPLIPQNRFASLVKDVFVDGSFILIKKGDKIPAAYDDLVHQTTVLYLICLIIFIPGLLGVISALFAGFMLYGLYHITKELDSAGVYDESSLINLRPVELEEYLHTLDISA